MDDIVHVTVIDGLEDLLNAVWGVRLRVVLPSDNVLEEFTPGDEIKDEVVVTFLLDAIMKTY